METPMGPPKRPDAVWHKPDPTYLRELLERAGLSQRGAARQLGLAERTMRYYLAGEQEAPYPVQYCLEVLAAAGPAGTGNPE